MKWIEFTIQITTEAVEPVSNILHEHGAGGVVIEDPLELMKERENVFGEIYQLNPADYPDEGVLLKAYFALEDFSSMLVTEIKTAVDHLASLAIDIGRNKITIQEVDEDDWATAWKQYYHPVKVSEQLTIVPTWEPYEAAPGEKIILLDPGMAFGTGTHATTLLCMRAIEKWVKSGMTVLDVGTGSGILSIAAARCDAESVFAMDLDAVAVTVAKDNCQVNGVSDVVTVSQNNLLTGVATKADVIVANILADIITLFTDDVARLLKPNGVFIASGIITEKQDLVVRAMEASGLAIVAIDEQEGWVAITARLA